MKTVRDAVEVACGRIAPTWPLDQFIAVNPYWGFLDDSIQEAAAKIESYSGSRLVMPRSFYREQLRSGNLTEDHLQAALVRSGLGISLEDLLRSLDSEPPSAPRVPLMTALADARRDLKHGMSVSDFVTHNLSQHCASYFDHCQSSWRAEAKEGLFESWLHHARTDRSPLLLMGLHHVRSHASSLPSEPMALIEAALRDLPIPSEQWPHYLTALLMSMNGWASWCAYERWQARLSGQEDDHIIQLLAIRLAWDHFAFVRLLDSQDLPEWKRHEQTPVDWVFQEALEIAYQDSLCQALTTSTQASPAVQAVFCIDVRSEVLRRCFENCSDEVQTLGFAGFFGLPISYTPLGTSAALPQLPGLIAPKLLVSDSTGSDVKDQKIRRKREWKLRFQSVWNDFRSSASSTFTFVESCGLFHAAALLRDTLPRPGAPKTADGGLHPCVSSAENLSDLAAGILKNMSLTENFARLVLIAGHGSQSANNPHAAGLDCGACGGHTGEVNARVLARLLNDLTVRDGLRAHGIAIPDSTYVLAALHNTTTDEITIFDTDLVPDTHESDLKRLQAWLEEASHRARQERAAAVGIQANSAKDLLRQFQIRSRDWSQVRPEWGLANNAAFLIAPRTRSRGVPLQGRVFLHEYRSDLDHDGSVLEAIMTAPLLVTNWINMQYYASTVDNRLYGSGNKVLHNVVGGRLGVFEGNGGDLRIGLPLQSLHDGERLRHTPLRLSVFIEAPQSVIAAMIQKHEVVRNLVQNGWLHLFQITPGSDSAVRYQRGNWELARA